MKASEILQQRIQPLALQYGLLKSQINKFENDCEDLMDEMVQIQTDFGKSIALEQEQEKQRLQKEAEKAALKEKEADKSLI